MNTEIDLFDSCRRGMFPSLKTMSKYGFNGEGGASPIDILNCYKMKSVDNSLIFLAPFLSAQSIN